MSAAPLRGAREAEEVDQRRCGASDGQRVGGRRQSAAIAGDERARDLHFRGAETAETRQEVESAGDWRSGERALHGDVIMMSLCRHGALRILD